MALGGLLPWSAHPEEPATIGARRIDDVEIVDSWCPPSRGSRGRTQIAATHDDYVVVLINRTGRETVGQGRYEATMSRGDAVVWDSGRPAWFVAHERVVKRSLLVPRAALHERPSFRPVRDVTDVAPPAVRLLADVVDVLVPTLPGLGVAAVRAARDAVVELLRGALNDTSDERPATESTVAAHVRRSVVERYLDQNLDRRGLSAESVAAAHHLSVRSLHRLFGSTGQTYSTVLRSKRLARVHADLLAGDDTIATLAARWGFVDSSHLGRHFRATYGMAPRDYRQLHGSGRSRSRG